MAVIATFDAKNFTWDLGIAAPSRVVYMGPENDNFFLEEEILPGLYEAKLIRSMPTCIKEIVQESENLRDWYALKPWDVNRTCETKNQGNIQRTD